MGCNTERSQLNLVEIFWSTWAEASLHGWRSEWEVRKRRGWAKLDFEAFFSRLRWGQNTAVNVK